MKSAYRRLLLQILLFPVLPVLAKGGGGEVPETAQEKALAEVAAQQYREYREKGVPLENAMIQRTDMKAPDYAAVEGKTNSEIQKAADASQVQRIAETSNRGIDAGSGANVMGMVRDANRVASAGASAGVKAGQAVEDQQYAGKAQMIAIGRGQSTDALQSMKEQASNAASTALSEKKLKVEGGNSTGAAIGTAAGMMTAAATDPNKKANTLAGGA